MNRDVQHHFIREIKIKVIKILSLCIYVNGSDKRQSIK